jgi:hypothetical protein
MTRVEMLEKVLAEHAPVNVAHHLGRFANLSEAHTSIQCRHQGADEPFMSEEEYCAHVASAQEEALNASDWWYSR